MFVVVNVKPVVPVALETDVTPLLLTVTAPVAPETVIAVPATIEVTPEHTHANC